MIKNRISRIALPFIVFLFLLWPTVRFTFEYTKAIFSKNSDPLIIATETLSSIYGFIPLSTFHLWFLYYLLLITFVSFFFALALKKATKITDKIANSFSWIIKKPILRVLFFSVLTFLTYLFIGISILETSAHLTPNLNTFIFYFLFYIIGWILFKSKHLLGVFMKYDWLSFILASIITTIQGLATLNWDSETFYSKYLTSEWIMLLNSFIIWLFIFGITGLFVRYGSNHSIRMRYISDSSYWVYLIHLPLTAILPAFALKLPFPAIVKFVIVLSISTVICFVTYHYCVRGTFIGKFLNGRKYPRKILEKPVMNNV